MTYTIISMFSLLAPPVVGALVGSFATYYFKENGIPFFNKKRIITKYEGNGKDIALNKFISTKNYTPPPNLVEDFIDKNIFSYQFKDTSISIRDNSIEVKGTIISTDSENISSSGTIHGKGVFNGDFAYVPYTGTYPGGIKWNGVFVLRISKQGDIRGYWLTEDIATKGPFAFGDLTLKRK